MFLGVVLHDCSLLKVDLTTISFVFFSYAFLTGPDAAYNEDICGMKLDLPLISCSFISFHHPSLSNCNFNNAALMR